MPILKGLKGLATFTGASAALFAGTWKLYTHNTTFVPFDSTTASFLTLSNPLRSRNPNNNPPALQDHCQRRVPLSRLQTTDQEELTRRFCAGVWSGWGFEYQKKKLEKEGRKLEGREEHLWEREEFTKSGYEVGTKIADHFEVVERTPGRVRALALFLCLLVTCWLRVARTLIWDLALVMVCIGCCSLWRYACQARSSSQRWSVLHGGGGRQE